MPSCWTWNIITEEIHGLRRAGVPGHEPHVRDAACRKEVRHGSGIFRDAGAANLPGHEFLAYEQMAGMNAFVPERRKDIAQLGLKSFIGGTLARFTTACIAGIILYE